MISEEMQRVQAIAQATFDQFKEGDERFNRTVVVIHEEGTVLNYQSAFLMHYYDKDHGNWGGNTSPGEWLFIFTEHHGVVVYPVSDLYSYQQYLPVDIEFHPGYPDHEYRCTLCGVEFIEPIMHDGDLTCPWCGLDEIKKIKEE